MVATLLRPGAGNGLAQLAQYAATPDRRSRPCPLPFARSLRPRARWWPVALSLVAVLVLAGCGGGADDAPPAEEAATELEVDLEAEPDPATYLDEGRGEPPTELVVEDLVVGDGAEATAGDAVRVNYVGVDWQSGQEFDSSWARGSRSTSSSASGR
jgi:hypothetical protein